MRYVKFILIALFVLIIDQSSKLWVYANMHLGEEFVLFNVIGLKWLKIHYTLNPGMAFGILLPPPYGKIMLSVFRIVAVIAISIYLKRQIDRQAHWGLLVSMTLIIAGALGNVLDSMFYGIFLKNNLPADAPFAFLHGQVIDMIFTDFWQGILPEWIPLLGGTYFAFPIFNIADSSIFVGVVSIILFQKKFFPKTDSSQEFLQTETSAESTSGLK
ncbi:lipoprotein signal peptidase [Raineya orbicola]|uniref:Lipoprotein signal peptidase n=1 Tax=Raineya orbicola TaxID=2016530 RepID=A0A2N3IIM7_9BACT|nr:lipoprotein signal peptidase [Raineya orbicola]PKQ70157.1 Lipoprotein signal peptidase [Raineya orbicola]